MRDEAQANNDGGADPEKDELKTKSKDKGRVAGDDADDDYDVTPNIRRTILLTFRG